MDILIESKVFFFISTIGFVILGAFVGVFLFYLIRITKTLSRITTKIEKDIDNISDTTKDMIEDMQDNVVYRFIFGKKHKKKRKIIK